MNWLYFFMMCLAGALSGVCTWLATPNTYHWDFSGNPQMVMYRVLLAAGLLCGFFVAFAVSVPVVVMERRFSKAARCWLSGAFTGLTVSIIATAIFLLTYQTLLPKGSLQFCWWFYFSVALAACFGIIHSDIKIMCRALMGLTPALIMGGSLTDRFFNSGGQQLSSLVLISVMAGFGLALAFDLLKDSWLDEEVNSFIGFRYYIDSGDFLIGSGSDCDLSLSEGPKHLFVITEKSGIHIAEACENSDQSAFKLNDRVVRYRALTDGDVISAGGRTLVYHTRLSGIRDELPAAVG